MKDTWTIGDYTNQEKETNVGSVMLETERGRYHVFKIEPNNYAVMERSLNHGSPLEEVKQKSREFAELVVRVLNRELPGGKLRKRKRGVK